MGLGLVVAFLYGMVWHEWGFKNRMCPKNFDVVEADAIYRSGQIDGDLIWDLLREHEIGVIVDLASDPDDEDEQAEIDVAMALGIRHETYPLTGYGTGDLEMYVRALATMAEARRQGKRVLVHCHGGSERSGATIAFWRVFVQGWEPDASVREMIAHQHRPKKNPRLLRYMNEHVVRLAERLLAEGVIDSTPATVPLFRIPE